MAEQSDIQKGRPPSEEQLFFLHAEREEFMAGLSRMSEAARQLIASVGVVAGLYLAVLQFKLSSPAPIAIEQSTAPVICWGLTIIFALITIIPLPYKHLKNVPFDIIRGLRKSQMVKWIFLVLASISFIAGLFMAVFAIMPH